MAFNVEGGNSLLRSKFYDKTIKNLAPRMYKFMQALTVEPTSAWKNFYWREDPAVLSPNSGPGIKGLAPGALFPHASQKYEQIQSIIDKYGLERSIVWEDILTNDLDMQARTLYKIAEGVTKAVDDQIYAVLSDNTTSSNIAIWQTAGMPGVNQIAQYGAAGTGGGWNQSSAAIIDDIGAGVQLIAEANIPTDDLLLFCSPRAIRNIKKYITDKGSQFTAFSDDIAKNGKVGKFAGVTLVETMSVPASRALLVKPKVCGSWKDLVPLQTTTIEDKFRAVTVRAVQEGVAQLHQPKAVVLFIGTDITQ